MLIKCPECQHEVSDMAPHCPSCGVEIAGHILTCPDCGKVVLSKETRCPNCGCEFTPAQRPPVKIPKPHKPRQEGEASTLKVVLWTLFILVLIAGVGGGAWWYYNDCQVREETEIHFAQLEGSNRVADYEEHLTRFPRSSYRNVVERRLARLREIERRWQEISLSPLRDDYVKFLTQFPHSAYEETCTQKIDSLDWTDAVATNTPDALQRYLDLHPQGLYVDTCRVHKLRLERHLWWLRQQQEGLVD